MVQDKSRSAAVFGFAASSLWVTACAATGALPTNEIETHSSMTFVKAVEDAAWCPSRHAMAAQVKTPTRATWAAGAGKDAFTVYVSGQLVAPDAYRVAANRVLVCLPAMANASSDAAQVLVYGPDSEGRPAQFDSSEVEPRP